MMMRIAKFVAPALLGGALLFAPVASFACEGDHAAKAEQAPAAKAGEKTLAVAVDGMHCAGCADHVKEAVGKLAGVSSVTPDTKSGTVTVVYDPAKTSPDAIRAALKKAGYPAKVA